MLRRHRCILVLVLLVAVSLTVGSGKARLEKRVLEDAPSPAFDGRGSEHASAYWLFSLVDAGHAEPAVAIMEALDDSERAMALAGLLPISCALADQGEQGRLLPVLDGLQLHQLPAGADLGVGMATIAAFHLDALLGHSDDPGVAEAAELLRASLADAEPAFDAEDGRCHSAYHLYLTVKAELGAFDACGEGDWWETRFMHASDPNRLKGAIASGLTRMPEGTDPTWLRARADALVALGTEDLDPAGAMGFGRAMATLAVRLDDSAWQRELVDWMVTVFHDELLPNEWVGWDALRTIAWLREHGYDDEARRAAAAAAEALTEGPPPLDARGNMPYAVHVQEANTAKLAVELHELGMEERSTALLDALQVSMERTHAELAAEEPVWHLTCHWDDLVEGHRELARAYERRGERERARTAMARAADYHLECTESRVTNKPALIVDDTTFVLRLETMEQRRAADPAWEPRLGSLSEMVSPAAVAYSRGHGRRSWTVQTADWERWVELVGLIPSVSDRVVLLGRAAAWLAEGEEEGAPPAMDAALEAYLELLASPTDGVELWAEFDPYGYHWKWGECGKALGYGATLDEATARAWLDRLVRGIEAAPDPRLATYAAMQLALGVGDSWEAGRLALADTGGKRLEEIASQDDRETLEAGLVMSRSNPDDCGDRAWQARVAARRGELSTWTGLQRQINAIEHAELPTPDQLERLQALALPIAAEDRIPAVHAYLASQYLRRGEHERAWESAQKGEPHHRMVIATDIIRARAGLDSLADELPVAISACSRLPDAE